MEAWEWRASASYNPNKVSQRDRWFLFRVDICSLIYANSSFAVLNPRYWTYCKKTRRLKTRNDNHNSIYSKYHTYSIKQF